MLTISDPYAREGLALRRAASALRTGARQPNKPDAPPVVQHRARERALAHLREAVR